MAKLPDYRALGPGPNPLAGGVIPSYSPAGFADTGIAQGLNQAAAAIDLFKKDMEEIEGFETKRKAYEFMSEADQQYQKETQNADPTGVGFAKQAVKSFDDRSSEFIASVPKRLQPQYEAEIARQRYGYSHKATTFELKQRQGYYSTEVNGLTDKILPTIEADPDSYDARYGQVADFVKAAGLPPAVKHKFLTDLEQKAHDSRIRGLAAQGRDDEALELAKQFDARKQQKFKMPKVGASGVSSPLEIAKQFEGAHEVSDRRVISEFIEKSAGTKIDPAKTAWCAAFVNAVLGASGREGTGSLMARSYLNYGTPTKKPSDGDIAVLHRGNPNGPYGHVGFFAGYDDDGNVKVLGGNQSNRVSVQSYSADRVLGFRKPPEAGSAYAPPAASQAAEAVAAGISPDDAGDIDTLNVDSIGGPATSPIQPVEIGNIDLAKRPRVKVGGGKIATVRSISINIDGEEILIPTVSDDGKILSEDEAVEQYKKTGKHLGKFKSPDDATAYGKWLSDQQGKRIAQPIEGANSIYARTVIAAAQDKRAKVLRAQSIEEERQRRLAENERKKISDDREMEIVKDVFSEKPSITLQQVTNDPDLTREGMERVLKIVEQRYTAAAKTGPTEAESQEATRRMMFDIRRPVGDPLKITDNAPIYDAFIQGKIRRTELDWLVQTVQNIRTPEGDNLEKRKAAFLKGVEQQIDKSNPLAGQLDPSGREQLYIFAWDLDQKIAQYRKDGKNPYDLLDPSKSDFMGRPESLSPYQKTLQQSIEDITKRVNPPSGAGSRVPRASTVAPRKPGESIEQYLKRRGIQ